MRGFSIFPVEVMGKRPHADAGEWGANSTRDPSRIAAYWNSPRGSRANIGVACKPSNLLVVDCDVAKNDWNLKGTQWEYVHGAYGARVDGVDLLDEIAYKQGGETIDPADTYAVRTGSGGMHLYYSWPPEWPRPSQASIVKGVIDVRNGGGERGGYVLGAGSVTAEGGLYEVISDAPVALPPMWLRFMVMERPSQPTGRFTGFRQPGAISHTGLVETVRNAQPGNRNHSLVWAARTMCEEGATEQEALSVLGPAAQDAGLSSTETERTIRSGYRTQQRKASR